MEEEEVEVEEVEQEEQVQEDKPNWPLPMETENWRARNPPSSQAIEQRPMSSCTNSNSTSSLIPTPTL